MFKKLSQINEVDFSELKPDSNSEKFLVPLMDYLKGKISGDWEFKIYTVNYNNENSGDWVQITLIDDPPSKVNVLFGNLIKHPTTKVFKEENFPLENREDIAKFIINNLE